jgi:beta-N-acetylhexosaminidase
MNDMRGRPLLITLVAMAMLPLLLAFHVSDPAKPAASDKQPARPGSWAQSALDSMTLDEKIGQLFMVAAYSNKDEAHYSQIEKLVRDQQIGGLIFMQGGPARQIALVNRYQKAARFPLLIAQDSEWGNSMRLDSSQRYPHNMTLGAIRDSLIIFELGMQMGKECRRVGVHVNFAPVVDVNNNPRNPVINDRSFGEDRENVATKGVFIYKGMEYSGAIGCAKHFPGHGDTDTDSHLDLPIIPHGRKRLDSLELYPFKKMIERGCASIMVAHLYIPALDTSRNLASTLSPKIVTKLLKEQMGFKGLIFTDALGMKGVTKYWAEGETELKAFLAGNDVLLFSADVAKAKRMIKDAILKGKATEADLNARVLKILAAKEWVNLHQNRISPELLPGELVNTATKSLSRRLYEQSVTAVKNDGGLLPFGALNQRSFGLVEIGSGASTEFYNTARTYAAVKPYLLAAESDKASRDKLLLSLKSVSTVIVGVGGMSKSASKGYGISEGTKSLLTELQAMGKEVVVVLFGSPYALKHVGKSEQALLMAYEDCADARIAAAEAIFGGIPVDGRLPITASAQFPVGTGLSWVAGNRFKFSLPEDAGMDGSILEGIDDIALEAIHSGATPGCAVLILRGNKIVFDRSYGRTEYGQAGETVDAYNTLYDLASVTKVCATTISAMRLWQEKKLDLDQPVSAYLQDWRGKGFEKVTVRSLLLHQAGFKAWIPFFEETFDSTGSGLRADVYASQPEGAFCVPVIDGIYMCTNYQDSMWAQIQSEGFKGNNRVLYSDLSMIVLRRVIEAIIQEPIDRFVDSTFYQPLGMNSTGFNPAITKPERTCAPTEIDSKWRHKKVQGYVHDQAAAMFGGVSGHAGLFSNVYDIAKLMLMLKSAGRGLDTHWFTPETVDYFTRKQVDGNRKALGWDRPGDGGTMATNLCSERTYGHTGFTGIGVWVDPQYDLVYVFLSNRTFPNAENRKLIQMNIRPRIQELAYQAILAFERRGAV